MTSLGLGERVSVTSTSWHSYVDLEDGAGGGGGGNGGDGGVERAEGVEGVGGGGGGGGGGDVAATVLLGDLASKRGAKAFDSAAPLNSTSEIFVANFEMVDCRLGFTNFAPENKHVIKFQAQML